MKLLLKKSSKLLLKKNTQVLLKKIPKWEKDHVKEEKNWRHGNETSKSDSGNLASHMHPLQQERYSWKSLRVVANYCAPENADIVVIPSQMTT